MALGNQGARLDEDRRDTRPINRRPLLLGQPTPHPLTVVPLRRDRLTRDAQAACDIDIVHPASGPFPLSSLSACLRRRRHLTSNPQRSHISLVLGAGGPSRPLVTSGKLPERRHPNCHFSLLHFVVDWRPALRPRRVACEGYILFRSPGAKAMLGVTTRRAEH
jgi:hypothetical protein